MSKNIKASIIILTHNNLDYTRQCLESIHQKTRMADYEIIAVDNASDDGTPAHLEEYATRHNNVQVVLNNINKGFPGGNNLGVESASGEYIVFLNNDIVVTEGWLSGLIRHLEDPTIGMIGPVTNSSGNETRIWVDYENIDDMDAFAREYTSAHHGQTLEIQMLPFHCVALRRKIFDEIGPLDERFGLGMFEDDDYALRLRAKDYRLICAEDVFLHHWGSASFSKLNPVEYWQQFINNKKLFEDKWGVKWQAQKLRPNLLEQQVNQIMDGSVWLGSQLIQQEQDLIELRAKIDEFSTDGVTFDQLKEELHVLEQQIALSEDKVNTRDLLLQEQQETIQEHSHIIQKLEAEIRVSKEQIENYAENESKWRQDVAQHQQNIELLEKKLRASTEKIQKQEQNLGQYRSEIKYRDIEIADLKADLNEIETSKAWKLVRVYRTIWLKLFPKRDIQAKKANIPNRVMRSWRRWGFWDSVRIVLKRISVPGFLQDVKRKVRVNRVTKDKSPQVFPQKYQKATFQQETTQPSFSQTERFTWPLVSVILPVYNQADLLHNAVKSILNNRYPRFELIILDDGSTDDIDSVLSEFGLHSKIRVYRQPNQKLPRALTHAHKFARGTFITWTSADNLLEPNTLQTLVDGLLSNPDAALVYGDVRLIDEAGNPLTDKTYRPHNLDPMDPSIVRLYRDTEAMGCEIDNFVNACFMYRADAARALGGQYADDLRGAEDYDFWLRLLKFGPSHHLENQEPLYAYRVHKRSMSHDLMTKELNDHLKRLDKLLQYEHQRKAYTEKRWTIVLGDELDQKESSAIETLVNQLPVNIYRSAQDINAAEKALPFVRSDLYRNDDIFVQSCDHDWVLHWVKSPPDSRDCLQVWKGCDITPLARKARYHVPDCWEFPQAGERIVVGCHLPLGAISLDLDSLAQVISQNPDKFFVFIDDPESSNPTLGHQIADQPENAIYLSEKPYGVPYTTYACVDLFWVPPLASYDDLHCYRTSLALSYAIGKLLLVPSHIPQIPAPYQLTYNPIADSFNFLTGAHDFSPDFTISDKYLQKWKSDGCLSEVLSFANTITQEKELPRPDFGIPAQEIQLPNPIVDPRSNLKIKVGIAIDYLDRGGLEGVVGLLTRNLSAVNIDAFVICTRSGGLTAQKLRREGHRIYIAGNDPAIMRSVLEYEKPDIINTHFTQTEFLEITRDLNIDIVETIHNTYVWFYDEDWKKEQVRGQCFSAAIAVSQLVKDYYIRWNDPFPPENVTVVPNSIDIFQKNFIPYNIAREKLGLTKNDIFFLNLASYDGRKNQLGLITAFDQAAQDFPNARLLCAGSILDDHYYGLVEQQLKTLDSRSQIKLEQFRHDAGMLLIAADAFILPSFFEGWSLGGTEALLAGTPLIHTECGSALELVGANQERGIIIPNPGGPPLEMGRRILDELVGRVDQPNAAFLEASLRDMMQNIDQWRAKRDDIQKFARANFRVDKMIQAYADVFEKVVRLNKSA